MKIRQVLLSLLVTMFMTGGLAWAGDAVNINSASAKELQKVDGIGLIRYGYNYLFIIMAVIQARKTVAS